MKATIKTVLFSVTALLCTLTTNTASNSLWDTLRAEFRSEGSVFKTNNKPTAETIVKSIENAGGVTKRNFDKWFGSQQDLVAGRFVGKPEKYTHSTGEVLHTFKADIPASQKFWNTLSAKQKQDFDGSPALIITITTTDEHSDDKTELIPVRIGKSRMNGYSVAVLQ